MVIKYLGLGHIGINVEDMKKSIKFYSEHFGAIPIQAFPHFSQPPFTENLGFNALEKDVDLTSVYMVIPQINLYFELHQYHYPKSEKKLNHDCANDLGLVNHINFRVENIDEIFEYFKGNNEIEFLNTDEKYKHVPSLNKIAPDQFHFFDEKIEQDHQEKLKVTETVGTVRFFIIRDFNGIHWEFEETEIPESVCRY